MAVKTYTIGLPSLASSTIAIYSNKRTEVWIYPTIHSETGPVVAKPIQRSQAAHLLRMWRDVGARIKVRKFGSS